MNFKLTKLKNILSIILGMIIGNLSGWQYTWSGWIFNPLIYIVSSSVLIVIIYLVWSLVQKKK